MKLHYYSSLTNPQQIDTHPLVLWQPRFQLHSRLLWSLGIIDPTKLIKHAVHMRVDPDTTGSVPSHRFTNIGHFGTHTGQLLHRLGIWRNVSVILLQQNINSLLDILGLEIMKAHLVDVSIQLDRRHFGNGRYRSDRILLHASDGLSYRGVLGL